MHPFFKRSLLLLSLAMVLGGFLSSMDSAPQQASFSSVSTAPGFVDIHCHTAGIGAGSDNFISKSLHDSYKFGFYLRAFGVTEEQIKAFGDQFVIKKLSEDLKNSRLVKSAVILALDGRVTDGELDRARTQVYISNDFVAREVRKYPNLLFGASVNPYRKNAIPLLRRAVTNGARLLKWIPSIQRIDPSDPDLKSFYHVMHELHLPLLVHTGDEHAFGKSLDTLNDPERLRLPLSMGLTVIAAHAAVTGENQDEKNITRLVRLMGEFPNLYADISSLTQINKIGYLDEVLQSPAFRGRLVYGSDMPMPKVTGLVSPFYFFSLKWAQMSALNSIQNAWDQDVQLKSALGFPRDVFERGEKLLRPLLVLEPKSH